MATAALREKLDRLTLGPGRQKAHVKALLEAKNDLKEEMDIKDVIRILTRVNVLDTKEQDALKRTESRKERVDVLLSLLQKRDLAAFTKFVEALIESECEVSIIDKLLNLACKQEVAVAHEVTKSRGQKNVVEKKENRQICHTLKVSHDKFQLRKCEIGSKAGATQERVILVIGATGTGKTTMINRMINHILGVDWADDYRYQLSVDADEVKLSGDECKSQTKWISAYKFHRANGFRVPADITFVDTPGFLDTENTVQLDRDIFITGQVKHLFTAGGYLDYINAVILLFNETTTRLTAAQVHLINSVTSLFAKDLSDNVFVFTTFSQLDTSEPPIVRMLNDRKLRFQTPVYRFNNNENAAADNRYGWEHGTKTLDEFFEKVLAVEPKSILMSSNVLQDREALVVYLAAIPGVIKTVLIKVTKLQQMQNAVRQHEQDIDRNKNFEYTETVKETVREVIDGKTTVCKRCKNNCHDPCDHRLVTFCSAMRWFSWARDDGCNVCDCPKSEHEHKNFRYAIKTENVTKTYTDIKQEYEKAVGKLAEQSSILRTIEQDKIKEEEKLKAHIHRVKQSLLRLHEMAYSPNVQTFSQYMDDLIAKEGSQDLVNKLREIKAKEREGN